MPFLSSPFFFFLAVVMEAESEKLLTNVQEVVNKLRSETIIDRDTTKALLSNKFDVGKPVSLPKLVGADVEHYMNYVHADLQNFQVLIQHRPFD